MKNQQSGQVSFDRFVEAFDGKCDIKLWQRICPRHSGGSDRRDTRGGLLLFVYGAQKGSGKVGHLGISHSVTWRRSS